MARFWEIDSFRGIAIIMMVIFHLMWDLKYFGFINFDLYAGFWGYFQIATAGLFLLLAGLVVSLSAQRHEKKYPLHFLKRGVFIFACGLLISAVTYIIFPKDFIYFGILHLIGVSIILSIPIARKKFIPLALAVLMIALPLLFNLQKVGIDFLVWVGLSVPAPTFDFEPLIPWFGAFLFGIFIGNWLYAKGKRGFVLKENNSKPLKFLEFLGKNSLKIYLLHQIVLFGLVYAISLII